MQDSIFEGTPHIEYLGRIRGMKSIVRVKCLVCDEIFYSTPIELKEGVHKCKGQTNKKEKNKSNKKTKELNEKELKRKRKERKLREFKKIRLEILERDEYKCVKCGSKELVHVHHIVKRSQGGDNSESNLETLCYKCHMEEHKDEPVYNLMKSRLRKIRQAK